LKPHVFYIWTIDIVGYQLSLLSFQWCAEITFDMVSPGPRRRGYYPRQPADLREGVSNAYIVLREVRTSVCSVTGYFVRKKTIYM